MATKLGGTGDVTVGHQIKVQWEYLTQVRVVAPPAALKVYRRSLCRAVDLQTQQSQPGILPAMLLMLRAEWARHHELHLPQALRSVE